MIEARENQIRQLQVDLFTYGIEWKEDIELDKTELFTPEGGGWIFVNEHHEAIPESNPEIVRETLDDVINERPLYYPEDTERMYQKLHELSMLQWE